MASSSTNNIYLAAELGIDFSVKRTIVTITPYIAGKIGYKFTERILAYVGFGGNLTNFMLKTPTTNLHKNNFGYETLGGLSYALTNQFVAGVEYKYRDSGRLTVTESSITTRYKLSENLVMARLSYKI